MINIFGLAIGLCAALFILRYVAFEQSYDRFHSDAEQIYRITTQNVQGNTVVYTDAMSFNAAGPALKDEFPEVLDYARAFDLSVGLAIKIGDEVFNEKNGMYADPSFLSFFNYPVLKGNPETVLSDPFSIVMTQSAAQKYFGEKEAIGQMVTVPSGQYAGTYHVTGLVEDVPQNTHLKFDMLISYSTFWQLGQEPNWNGFNDYVYFKVAEGTDIAE